MIFGGGTSYLQYNLCICFEYAPKSIFEALQTSPGICTYQCARYRSFTIITPQIGFSFYQTNRTQHLHILDLNRNVYDYWTRRTKRLGYIRTIKTSLPLAFITRCHTQKDRGANNCGWRKRLLRLVGRDKSQSYKLILAE